MAPFIKKGSASLHLYVKLAAWATGHKASRDKCMLCSKNIPVDGLINHDRLSAQAPEARGSLSILLNQLSVACKFVESSVRKVKLSQIRQLSCRSLFRDEVEQNANTLLQSHYKRSPIHGSRHTATPQNQYEKGCYVCCTLSSS